MYTFLQIQYLDQMHVLTKSVYSYSAHVKKIEYIFSWLDFVFLRPPTKEVF